MMIENADYKIILIDPALRGLAIEIFGTTILPVQSPDLILLGEQLVFKLDMERITNDQRIRLAAYLAGKFHLEFHEVERKLECMGFPIPAHGCQLVISFPLST